MKTKQQGFTLVELVVVIVILGILAATAIPKYASYTKEARIASLNGLAGAIRSAVVVVQGRYIATGAVAGPVLMADGVSSVATSAGANGGIPTAVAGGIDVAMNTGGTFSFAAGLFSLAPTAIAGCDVTYAATGLVTVNPGSC